MAHYTLKQLGLGDLEKNHRIVIQVSERQKKLIQKGARHYRKTVSEFMRWCAGRVLRQEV